MTIYFSTNIPEFRSILQLNRSSNRIAEISQRLETGQRINSGKDDPEGLIIRDRLRADMKGLYTAQSNIARANDMLSVADNGLASLSSFLLGNTDDGTTGLKALVNSTVSSTAESDALKSNIAQTLNMMNGVARSTTYNGKQIINGDLAYKTSFTADAAKISNLSISKANGGNQAVSVNVSAAATKTKGAFTLSNTDDIVANEGDSITVRYNGTDYSYTIGAADITGGNVAAATLTDKLGAVLNGSGLNVTYDTTGHALSFESDGYGSSNTLHLSTNGTAATASALAGLADVVGAAGTDAVVTVNGQSAKVNGTHVSFSDAGGTLSLTTDVGNVAGTTTFNVVSGGATFQLGKNVLADQQLQFGLSSANTSNLGGNTGRLNDLLGLDFTNASDVKKASAIVDEAIDSINAKRGQIGFMQGNVLSPMKTYVEDDLASVTEAEGTISNVDTAMESSRLAREELLANNAMNAALFNQQYAQFLISSLW